MLRIGFALLMAALLAPALAAADAGTPYLYCEDVCSEAAKCCPPCFTKDCMAYCLQRDSLYLYDCRNYPVQCADFNECACAGEPDGDDMCADNGDDHHDDHGCGVTRGAQGFALPLAMFGIGLVALAYSLRSRRW